MKLTKPQLKQIIKEELGKALKEYSIEDIRATRAESKDCDTTKLVHDLIEEKIDQWHKDKDAGIPPKQRALEVVEGEYHDWERFAAGNVKPEDLEDYWTWLACAKLKYPRAEDDNAVLQLYAKKILEAEIGRAHV